MWIFTCEVEIMAPMSMLRFQVKDNRPETESFGQPAKEKEKKEELEKKSSSTAITDVPDDDHETKLVQKKERYSCSQDRTMDAFQACVHSTADKAQELGLQTLGSAITEGGRKRRRNAGELYVSLRLKLLVSKVSSCFAYALDPPRLEHYGAWKQEVILTKPVDVQRCYDDFYEVKVHVLDNALLCCVYGFKYLVSWRSISLSLMPGKKRVVIGLTRGIFQSRIYLVGLLACCFKTYLTWAIMPLLLALSLFINSFPEARYYMTRGGLNAALTEEGFKQTAAWRDSGEILKFIERLLREDMTPGCDLLGMESRTKQPASSLEEVRLALLAADYVVDQQVSFNPGASVWVDGRFPAHVVSSDGERVRTLLAEDKPPEEVRARQLLLRADALGMKVPEIPSVVPLDSLMKSTLGDTWEEGPQINNK
eukprot:g19244.t1